MPTKELLVISFVMFTIIYWMAYKYNVRIMFFIGGLLWFVPLINIEDPFIKVVSISMFIMSLMLAFYNKDKGGSY